MPLYKVNRLHTSEHPDRILHMLVFLVDFVLLILTIPLLVFYIQYRYCNVFNYIVFGYNMQEGW